MNPTQNQAVVKKDEKPLEFVPFGAQDKIRLTIAIVKNVIATKTKTGRTCSDQDAMKFMMLCQARALNPFEGDAFLIGYDSYDKATGTTIPKFSLITAHQAFLKRAELHPEFDGMQSGIILVKEDGTLEEREGDFHLADESDSVVGGWARVFFKNRKHPIYRRLRVGRFDTGMAEWAKDRAGMICKCAEADALRSAFPTKMGGMYMHGEMQSTVTSEPIDIPAHNLVALPEPTTADNAPPTDQNDDGDLGPQTAAKTQQAPPTPTVTTKARTPKELLQDIATQEAGCNLQEFCKWAAEGGHIKNADSITTWDEIPAADAQRLIRNRAGLIGQLRMFKEAK